MRRLSKRIGVLACASAGAALGACVLAVASADGGAQVYFVYDIFAPPPPPPPGNRLAALAGALLGAVSALAIVALPSWLGARRTAVRELGVCLGRSADRGSPTAQAARELIAVVLLGVALASPALLVLLGLGAAELDALCAALPATPLTVVEPALAWSLGGLGACLLAGLAIRLQLRLRPRRGRRLAAGALALPLASALLGLLAFLPVELLLLRAERLEERALRRWTEARAAWSAGDEAHAHARWQRGRELMGAAGRIHRRLPVVGSGARAERVLELALRHPAWPGERWPDRPPARADRFPPGSARK